MRSYDISKVNEANFVLKHFIDLSARLLPFLDELQRKRELSLEECDNRNKIMDVFENYQFDTRTSELLINSNILDLICKAFNDIRTTSYFLRPNQKNKMLARFLLEYRRLNENWGQISAN
ncbi:MAG: hypothetical protein MK105_09235 [Crocinitomicaceae bacterium]|nr:hypothetical protein [Crocinitomicaceae bacterium]